MSVGVWCEGAGWPPSLCLVWDALTFDSKLEGVSRSTVSQLFATPWTVARQAPLSMGFPRQEYWSGLPFLSPGNLPDPGIEPRSPAFQTDSSLSESGKPSLGSHFCFCFFNLSNQVHIHLCSSS